MFSLDKKQKYRILKPEFAIRCIPDDLCLVYGNNFDASGICIYSGFLNNSKSYVNNKNKAYDLPSDNTLTEESNFSIKEIEVYQVIFKE